MEKNDSFLKYFTQSTLHTQAASDYTLKITYIKKLASNQQYEEAIANCNQFIQEIQSFINQSNDFDPNKLQNLAKDLIRLNQLNYETCFNHVFHNMTIESAYTFLNNTLNEAKVYTKKGHYNLAICIFWGFNQFIHKILDDITVTMQVKIPLKLLLDKSNAIGEYIYFNWLNIDEKNFIRYHFKLSDIKLEITEHFLLIKENLSKKNYSQVINLQSKFITNLNQYSAQAYETSDVLTQAWYIFIILRRQQSAFTWLVNNYLDFYVQDEFIELLQADLLFLSQRSYFFEKIKLEAQIKLQLINLLFIPSIHRTKLARFRSTFCSAFDTFSSKKDNLNTAISLVGLGMINAYEGKRKDMLAGFKWASEYVVSLNPLIQAIAYQSLFHLEQPLHYIQEDIINPFIKWQSMPKSEPLKLRPM